jgi:hypothetical protein
MQLKTIQKTEDLLKRRLKCYKFFQIFIVFSLCCLLVIIVITAIEFSPAVVPSNLNPSQRVAMTKYSGRPDHVP